MAAGGAAAGLHAPLLLLLLQALPSCAEIHCTGYSECPQQGTSWTSLWYVWLILLTVFLLLMCGIGASCVKICCRKKRPPAQTFPPHARDFPTPSVDHNSTAQSTVTSYSSLRYPQSLPLPLPFREPGRSLPSPPAYSLYAIELPPSYDEAIKIAAPSIQVPLEGQKREESPSQSGAPAEQNPSETLSTVSDNSLEVGQPDSVVLEVSTQESPQL